MIRRNGRGDKRSCPYIDGADPRCASHFTLGQIGQAFSLCLNNHERCSTYQRIQREAKRKPQFIDVTCSIVPFAGSAHPALGAVPAALQATGT